MARPSPRDRELARLVDHMFDQVLDDEERAELLVWIRRWEDRNPGVDPAHRVTGWIDVAYEFQARRDGTPVPTSSTSWPHGTAVAL